MIDAGLRVRSKGTRKGYGITDGRYMLHYGGFYIYVTWKDDGEPYSFWIDLRRVIITVKAKSRPLNSLAPVRLPTCGELLADLYRWCPAGDSRSKHGRPS